jgi:glutaredoxin
MNKGALAVLFVIILICGCAEQVSNEDVEKVLNGTDRKNVSVSILMYYGDGCTHCENTMTTLNALNKSYNISMAKKEVWNNKTNQDEMNAKYGAFGYNPDDGGVPTMVINGKMMIIGELSIKNWIKAIELCGNRKCPSGVFGNSEVSALS